MNLRKAALWIKAFLILAVLLHTPLFHEGFAADEDKGAGPLKAEELGSWDELLKKAKERAGANEAGSPGKKEVPAKKPGEIEKEWVETLKTVGYAAPVPPPTDPVKTYYKAGGSLQSERVFKDGFLEKLKWYNSKGALVFEGDFEKGKLIHRKRYQSNGELESEWP